jgi:hypothetical protein
VGLLHGSLPNTSDTWRVGLAARFVATHVRPRQGRQAATLVLGTDAFGYFDHQPRPRRDDDPEAMASHARAVGRYADQFLSELRRDPSPRRILSALRLLRQPARLRFALRYLADRARGR